MGILRDCFWDVSNQMSKLDIGINTAGQNANSSPVAYKVLDQRPGAHGLSCYQAPSYSTDVNFQKVESCTHAEKGWFSNSLPDVFLNKLTLTANDIAVHDHRVDNATSLLQVNEDEYLKSFEEIEAYTIKNLLPDDDELFSGVLDEPDCIANASNLVDETEDFDLFSSGGGLELDVDSGDKSNINSNNKVIDLFGGTMKLQQSGSNASVIGEHPYGEHPSRTLFVRNINSNVEDSELKALFEQYGTIRTLYTSCKHRGFVMVSYYDIRAARSAMRALQNKPLRRRKLDIHFSIPKDNPSEKDVNQGTLVVFNLDPSVSNDDLRQVFGEYGEVKEIRETPHKKHHKFIEFYDVRAAEAALKALNKSDIAGKRIKLEPSRPGGARRCLMQQFYQDLEQESMHNFWQQGSTPVNSGSSSSWTDLPRGTSSAIQDNESMQIPNSSKNVPQPLFPERPLHSAPRSAALNLSTPVRVPNSSTLEGPIIAEDTNHLVSQIKPDIHTLHSYETRLLPDYSKGILTSLPFSSSPLVSAMIPSPISRSTDSVQNRGSHGIQSGNFNSLQYEHKNLGFSLPGNDPALSMQHTTNGTSSLHGNQFPWDSPDCYKNYIHNSLMWSGLSSYGNGMNTQLSQLQGHLLPCGYGHPMAATLALRNHCVGSAPISDASYFGRQHGQIRESPDASILCRRNMFGGVDLARTQRQPSSLHPTFLNQISANGAMDSLLSSSNSQTMSPQKKCHAFSHSGSFGSILGSQDNGNSDRGRGRRSDNGNQIDSKKQYHLDIDKILSGEDTRTTLMIKNIPNKYTSKMLLATIDEHHRGTYDFIYLPIDFKNKCNVGYSFINMVDPLHIVSFYKAFNGKKWEKFNSEKVASLAYARIQGKAALIAHFQNSSLMNEDKRCRPIIFHTDGPNAGDQEPFPVGQNVRTRPGKIRTSNFGSHQGSPNFGNDENAHGSESSRDSFDKE